MTYVENGQVMVSHTDGNDARWSAPMALPGSGTLRSEDISSVIAFGPGRIGVMWSDQQRQQMLFAWHRDGDRDQVWSPVETVAEGAGSADNHLNLKAFQRDGKTLIAAAVKTSRDTVPDVNPLDPQILVMIRTDDGTWTGYEAGRIIDRHSRPIILIDETRRLLYVAAQSPFGGGSVYMKQTDLDHPAFPTGTGDLLLTSAKDTAIANASSTKGAISPSTGLVVMASDDGTGRFLHAAMDLGGTPIPTGVVDATRPERPKVVDAGPYLIVDDTFDAWDVGQDPGAGWTPTVTSGTVAVRKDGSAHVLRQTTSGRRGPGPELPRHRARWDRRDDRRPLPRPGDRHRRGASRVGPRGGRGDRRAARRRRWHRLVLRRHAPDQVGSPAGRRLVVRRAGHRR